jgi:hypothetical protein
MFSFLRLTQGTCRFLGDVPETRQRHREIEGSSSIPWVRKWLPAFRVMVGRRFQNLGVSFDADRTSHPRASRQWPKDAGLETIKICHQPRPVHDPMLRLHLCSGKILSQESSRPRNNLPMSIPEPTPLLGASSQLTRQENIHNTTGGLYMQ